MIVKYLIQLWQSKLCRKGCCQPPYNVTPLETAMPLGVKGRRSYPLLRLGSYKPMAFWPWVVDQNNTGSQTGISSPASPFTSACCARRRKRLPPSRRHPPAESYSTFDTNASGGDGSLEPNTTYDNFQWILVRDNGKTWEVKT